MDLSEKLGVKENSRVAFLNHPLSFPISLITPPSSQIADKLEGQFDLIQFFAQDKRELEAKFPRLKKSLKKDGALWISWKKQKPRSLTDLNENKIREIGLQNGLADTKVISIDEIWSGLKFVYYTPSFTKMIS